MGPATVGTVGYEGRLDYTAIGSVVNLASRLCSSANDAQILVDAVVAERVKESFALVSLGNRIIKGYDQALPVFAVAHGDANVVGYPDCRLQRPRLEPAKLAV
jgi:class 3 adenylate cyclase